MSKVLSRRSLFRAGAGVGGALGLGSVPWLGGCARDDTRVSAADRALQALGGEVKGRLLFPTDDAYGALVRPNNAVWSHAKPKAIALCTGPGDVQACLKYLADYGDEFAVRSGGHSYAGYSTTNGLLIHVGYMKGAQLDMNAGTVTIQAGMSNQDLATSLRAYPLAIPSGRCPTVGASGLVLGGGWGFAATKAGLTSDSLLSTDVILADGRLVQANASSEADLFWAARGAGGGNFGVHTAFTFKLLPVGKLTTFNVKWPAGNAVDIMLALQKLQNDNARTVGMRFKMLPERTGTAFTRDEIHAEALGIYWGPSADLRQLLNELFRQHPPRVADLRDQDYWDARDYLVTDDPEGLYDLRSSYVEEMSREGLNTMIDWMTRWPGGNNLQENMGIFFAIGGAVRDIAADATAYNHRTSNFIVQQEVSWSALDSDALRKDQTQWLSEYYVALQPFVQPRSYVNFPDRTMVDWAARYYGNNLARLTQAKGKYDPQNRFRFAQSIPLPI